MMSKEDRVVFVKLRYASEDGVTHVLERHEIDVSVDGAQLLGLGSACPFYRLPYTGTRTDTYFGEVMAVVRNEAGVTATLRASDGERAARVESGVAG